MRIEGQCCFVFHRVNKHFFRCFSEGCAMRGLHFISDYFVSLLLHVALVWSKPQCPILPLVESASKKLHLPHRAKSRKKFNLGNLHCCIIGCQKSKLFWLSNENRNGRMVSKVESKINFFLLLIFQGFFWRNISKQTLVSFFLNPTLLCTRYVLSIVYIFC